VVVVVVVRWSLVVLNCCRVDVMMSFLIAGADTHTYTIDHLLKATPLLPCSIIA
jgi:hypothetical protein